MNKKVFYSSEILEFKINGKWVIGSLKDIDTSKNKFILSLDKEDTNKNSFESQGPFLMINDLNIKSALNNASENYSKNQKIEFYDDATKGWVEGNIKANNNDFYIITYNNKNSFNNSKILYKENIRTVTKNEDIIKLNIELVNNYSLRNFELLSNPLKYAKKFIKQLIDLLGQDISFVFLNDNLDLFIFRGNNKETTQSEIINGLIGVAFKHFEEIDKINKKLFK